MSLASGTRIGQYDIVTPIGSGGMGEVYRARDTRLNREVALKVLPELFLQDPDRLARFQREAQLLASLNHPNIAHIYEAGREGFAFLALELVPGPTLAERLARGPLALDDALAIARQIVDALETAHEQGVIHRDLKPANIKVRDDGTVKVLDFGLAKALAPQGASGADVLNSPTTMSARGTEMGVILGTAAYMSPEQAKGKTADQRADVWAFGVVLFEMLTGKQVFTGETPSEVMASVMKEEPDWTQLPANLPTALRRLLRRCLEKDPKKRMSAMSDVRLELSEKDVAVPAAPVSARGSRWALAGAAAGGALLTAIGFFVAAPSLRSTPPAESSRVAVLGPSGVTLAFDAAESAISPDGRTVVFTANDANGATRLWIRRLDSLDAVALAGTETGHLPFWSPDSRQVAFFSSDKLKKMPAAGGTVQVICDAKDGRGGTWGSRNIIVFAPASAGPLLQVPADGGSDPKPATALDAAKNETGHRFPSFLPDGRHFLFAALPQKNMQFELYVGSIDDGSRQPLMPADGAAVYAAPGYVLFVRKGVLFARSFDAGKLQLSGDPVAIGDAPGATGGLYSSGRAVSVSTTGTIAYLGDRLPNTNQVWLDRNGRQTGTLAVPDGRYQELAIAPDGKRAALVRFETQSISDIWIVDLARGGGTRFTSQQTTNFDVSWSPDGTRIAYSSDVAGPRNIFVKPSSGATPEQPLYESPALFKDTRAWSPDGKFLMFEQLDPKTNRDLWMVPTDGSGKPRLYLQTPYNETFVAFSPDGRWLAYTSDESGHNEIYVDAFPVPRSKFKVSDTGAVQPSWSRDGRELMMLAADFKSILVSDVTAGPGGFNASPARKLFDFPKAVVNIAPMPDHQRVLASLDATDNTTSTLTLIFNWVDAIKK